MGQRHKVARLALIGLSVSITGVVSALLAVNAAPTLLPALLGLKHIGYLGSALPPDPTPLTLDGRRLDRIELLLPPRLPEPVSLIPAEFGADFIGDTSLSGNSTYLLVLDEAGINTLLRRWFLPDGTIGGRYRDLWVDLQPGGLILYANVNLGLRWQRMGLLSLLDGIALSPTGLVIDQELYALPTDGFLAQVAPRVRLYSERTLEALALVGPLPGEAHVSRVRFHADRVEILAQAAQSASPPPDTGW